MAWMDPLTTNLLDLLCELREHSIPLPDFLAVLSEIFHA